MRRASKGSAVRHPGARGLEIRLLSKPGYVTGLFLVGYGVIRALLENVRQPDAGLDHLPFGLTMGMILSTPMMLVGAWLIWRAWKTAAGRRPGRAHEPQPEKVTA
jgi:prolipoprotein diacylglyceryltransferase